ncbi:hypothetical protein [Bdellovibrio bacteriovorus]|uniref:Lipoprotein n=1 Tax=Bdellovibrio bacteriovorus str. Tiberius TaxID=1069642 RepID=K7ZGQ7_BDEBC|nr:hypothetical protein [Bdellovibrio bacteriovorus]AFY02747.1 hypothetical protein Bdt_3072 [Bdellovibrio bacteriovorus str. Tiberius]
MKCVKQAFIILLSLVLTTSCAQPNLLTDVSDTDSDDALYYEAKKKLDALEWDEAIDIIENQLSPTYAAKVSVKETLAGAYAGKCGFTFVDIISGMQNSPSANIFPFFVSIFGGNTLDTASCDQAISIISSLGTVLQRTQDQNLFMTILGIARIGTTISAKLDPTNDGVVDGVYNTNYSVCHNYSGAPGTATATDGWAQPGPSPQNPLSIPAPVVAPTRSITDTEAKKVASGIGLIFENISALASVLSGDNSTLTALQDALEQCESVAGAGNCTATNEAAVGPELLYTIRVLMDTNGMGFGACDPTKVYPDAAACCPRLKIPGF